MLPYFPISYQYGLCCCSWTTRWRFVLPLWAHVRVHEQLWRVTLSAFDRGCFLNNSLKETLKISTHFLQAKTTVYFSSLAHNSCFFSFSSPGQAASGDGDGAPAPDPLQGDREQRRRGGGDQAVLQQEGKRELKRCVFSAGCCSPTGPRPPLGEV